MTDWRGQAWEVVEACAGEDGLLRAAAESALYPHVWTRDVALASLGILACARDEGDAELVADSLACIANHQDELGRIPLKIDVEADASTLENSAGVDAGMWFAIAVDALRRSDFSHLGKALVEPAIDGMHWCRHLDVNGDLLLEVPEASDWADMMPHRHHVLFSNVLYVEGLRAASRLADDATLAELATRIAERIHLLFRVGEDGTDPDALCAHLRELAEFNPEWAISKQYATRWGTLPYYLPYVDFRRVGRHCDIVGNLLSVLVGIGDDACADEMLDYLDQVGAWDPAPTKTIYPPIRPGDPDYRDYFHWRNLCLPHHYQNGGSWPFAGALHVLALVKQERLAEAEQVFDALVEANLPGGEPLFPEWQHGKTGQSMGESHQLWSATGLLWAAEAIEQEQVPILKGAEE